MKIHYHENTCQEMMFNGVPVMCFIIAVMINTFRWYQLQVRLLTGQNSGLRIRIGLSVAVSYSGAIIATGGVVFGIHEKDLTRYKVYAIIASVSFFTQHAVVVILNIVLWITFKIKIKNQLPELYAQIKNKYYTFTGFVIILVIARLVAFSIYYYFSVDFYTILVRPEEIVILITTEITPGIVIILAFLVFSNRENYKAESYETTDLLERLTIKSEDELSEFEHEVEKPLIIKKQNVLFSQTTAIDKSSIVINNINYSGVATRQTEVPNNSNSQYKPKDSFGKIEENSSDFSSSNFDGYEENKKLNLKAIVSQMLHENGAYKDELDTLRTSMNG